MFGMSTGGSSPPLSPQWYISRAFREYILISLDSVESQLHRKYQTSLSLSSKFHSLFLILALQPKSQNPYQFFPKSLSRSSPRPISIGQLNTLLHLHLRPINLIVSKGSYYLMIWDILS